MANPTLTFTFNKKIAGSLTGGNFGQSITRINGTTQFNNLTLFNLVAIGNTNSFGAVGAYAAPIANQTAPGDWVEQIQLHPSDQTLGDDCEADDLSGNFLLVGSAAHNSNEGAAYVFKSTATSQWVQQQELTGSDSAAGDFFVGLSIYGNTLVCGATGHNSGQGAAYVFNQINGVWTQVQKIVPADAIAGSGFGDDGIILGTQMFISNLTGSGSSAVYYYELINGTWVQQQKISPPTVDAIGYDLAFDGLSLVVGSPSATGGGAAYVYQANSAGQFVLVQTLKGSDTVASDDFGYGVAVQGSVIAVGAINNDTNGAVYIFNNPNQIAGQFVQSQKIVQSDPTGSDNFGCKVALYSGAFSWLVVGAYANLGTGSAYFYSAPDPSSPVLYKSQLAFCGVRRQAGKDPTRSNYKFHPKYYVYPLQTILETVGVVGGQFAPIITLTQTIDNYDFDLYQLAITYDGPNGPLSLSSIYTALQVYDVNQKQCSNLPVMDTYYNGAPGSKYKNGAFVPPLYYPVNSLFRVDITNLISNPALLPVTMTIHLIGRQRIPC